MKGHLGALVTSGLAAVALALALLQAAVLIHGVRRHAALSQHHVQSNRYSAPGGRSGVPYMPFEKAPTPATPATTPEGRSPEKQQEERRTPPPPRQRSFPMPGPHPPRRAVA